MLPLAQSNQVLEASCSFSQFRKADLSDAPHHRIKLIAICRSNAVGFHLQDKGFKLAGFQGLGQ